MAVWISALLRGPIFTFKYSPNLRGISKRNSKITKVVNRHMHKEISNHDKTKVECVQVTYSLAIVYGN